MTAPGDTSPPSSRTTQGRRSRGAVWATIGVFFVVAAVYLLTSPGRIDMIDGQFRYEVAANLLSHGEPTVRDPALQPFGVPGPNGKIYARYGAGGSVIALPLLWIADRGADPDGEVHRFLFTLATPLVAAAACAVLFSFLLRLAVPAGRALSCTAIVAFSSLLWPSAVSTFPNAQYAFFFLAALLLGHESARRGSLGLAAAGGAVLGLLVTYDEYLLCLVPGAASCTIAPAVWDRLRGDASWLERARSLLGAARRDGSLARFVTFAFATLLGVALFFLFNRWRFGSILHSGKVDALPEEHAIFGNPLGGFLGLLVSPGKGVIWYSPPILLGALGLRDLLRRHRSLGLALLLSSVTLLFVLSPVAFWAGDWCWGPRYLTVVVPAFGLAMPAVVERARKLTATVAVAGLVVQLLAVSVDHQRFFFERALPDHFWAKSSWVYFERSQLLARPAEVLAVLRGPPKEAVFFNNAPDPQSLTYCTFGPRPELRPHAALWMQHFQLYFLPRPWPLWMSSGVPQRQPPIDVGLAVLACVVLAGLGAVLVRGGLRANATAPPE
mgnify:CR=1 FL=1